MDYLTVSRHLLNFVVAAVAVVAAVVAAVDTDLRNVAFVDSIWKSCYYLYYDL